MANRLRYNYPSMAPALWILAIVLLAVAAGLAWAGRLPARLLFYSRLMRAQRQASRFYAECPWVAKDIAYDPDTSCRLDVYRPDGGSGRPVIVYVYGGGWANGYKELYAPAAQRLVPEGFVLVVPDYTLFPAAGYPRQTEEIAAAIAWTLDHIAEFGGDPARVIVVTQSAGAQIAGLAALEPRWLDAQGHSAAELRGFVGMSGVYDVRAVLDHHARKVEAQQHILSVFGGAGNIDRASPLAYASPLAPSTLLIHGDADAVVPLPVAVEFDRRLRAAGVASQLSIYHGAGHADILLRALAERPPRLLNDIVTFARRCTDRDSGRIAGEGNLPVSAPAAGAENPPR